MHPTLLILAAGMGSRYGGLKQLDPMGPEGETVLDYSVYDAIKAGFGKIVFVIRREFEDAFKASLGTKFEDKVEVDYAFQELTDLPKGYSAPEGRQKPWGTAHAVWAARRVINTPFAVINADDFYGRDAYIQLVNFFKRPINPKQLHACIISYKLENTLSAHGTVNRGICSVENSTLSTVMEYIEITRDEERRIIGKSPAGNLVQLTPDTPVSMNFWGFTPALFPQIETYFTEFLESYGKELKSECYLPNVIDKMIRSGQTECTVIKTSGTWFGVTYPEDKASVKANITKLIKQGTYPKQL